MRLGYYNNWLFTTGQDGCIVTHEIKEKDSRGIQREIRPIFSDEILAEKQYIDDTKN